MNKLITISQTIELNKNSIQSHIKGIEVLNKRNELLNTLADKYGKESSLVSEFIIFNKDSLSKCKKVSIQDERDSLLMYPYLIEGDYRICGIEPKYYIYLRDKNNINSDYISYRSEQEIFVENYSVLTPENSKTKENWSLKVEKAILNKVLYLLNNQKIFSGHEITLNKNSYNYEKISDLLIFN